MRCYRTNFECLQNSLLLWRKTLIIATQIPHFFNHYTFSTFSQGVAKIRQIFFKRKNIFPPHASIHPVTSLPVGIHSNSVSAFCKCLYSKQDLNIAVSRWLFTFFGNMSIVCFSTASFLSWMTKILGSWGIDPCIPTRSSFLIIQIPRTLTLSRLKLQRQVLKIIPVNLHLTCSLSVFALCSFDVWSVLATSKFTNLSLMDE